MVLSLQRMCPRHDLGWRLSLTGAGAHGLADEQAALRRVATLVARGVPAGKLFREVTEEAALLFPTDWTVMCRYVPDG